MEWTLGQNLHRKHKNKVKEGMMARLERVRLKRKIEYWANVISFFALIAFAIWFIGRMFHYAHYIDSTIK